MTFSEQHHSLLEAARLGDTTALDRLLQVCQPDIRRYAYRHCLMSDVDDAVQETLLIVTRSLRSLRAVAAFSGWLFRVVQRECRRLERRVFGLDPYDEEKMESWLVMHSDETIRLDLISALESLPDHYREVILLRDFDGMTIREMAAQIRLTTTATKSRLRRARELVREYLLT
ncbi:MAG: RNA polymerase sigma factor [Gallionella sp.]|nr:RNA polymerase sigma factor [Gallionella sp.]